MQLLRSEGVTVPRNRLRLITQKTIFPRHALKDGARPWKNRAIAKFTSNSFLFFQLGLKLQQYPRSQAPAAPAWERTLWKLRFPDP